jgi:hypothetical protein
LPALERAQVRRRVDEIEQWGLRRLRQRQSSTGTGDRGPAPRDRQGQPERAPGREQGATLPGCLQFS